MQLRDCVVGALVNVLISVMINELETHEDRLSAPAEVQLLQLVSKPAFVSVHL